MIGQDAMTKSCTYINSFVTIIDKPCEYGRQSPFRISRARPHTWSRYTHLLDENVQLLLLYSWRISGPSGWRVVWGLFLVRLKVRVGQTANTSDVRVRRISLASNVRQRFARPPVRCERDKIMKVYTGRDHRRLTVIKRKR